MYSSYFPNKKRTAARTPGFALPSKFSLAPVCMKYQDRPFIRRFLMLRPTLSILRSMSSQKIKKSQTPLQNIRISHIKLSRVPRIRYRPAAAGIL